MIEYRLGNELALAEVIDLYRQSTLGLRRPVDEPERMRRMLAEANLVVSAWDGDVLVGIARSLTDFAFATYLADLAVRQSHQRRGIGRELIERTRLAAPLAALLLHAAPAAVDYYPRVGFSPASGWILRPGEPLE